MNDTKNENKISPRSTWSSNERKARIDAIRDEIQAKKKLTLQEVYRFALNAFGISTRIIDTYLKELKMLGLISIEDTFATFDPEKTQVTWKGE